MRHQSRPLTLSKFIRSAHLYIICRRANIDRNRGRESALLISWWASWCSSFLGLPCAVSCYYWSKRENAINQISVNSLSSCSLGLHGHVFPPIPLYYLLFGTILPVLKRLRNIIHKPRNSQPYYIRNKKVLLSWIPAPWSRLRVQTNPK
jgi:hypothetical protein